MWLFTNHGFLSIVQHLGDPEKLLVRARVRKDLEQFIELLNEISEEEHPVAEMELADYRFRTFADRDAVAEVFASIARSIEYGNFKNAVHGDPKRDDAYFKVWEGDAGVTIASVILPFSTIPVTHIEQLEETRPLASLTAGFAIVPLNYLHKAWLPSVL